MKFYLLLAFLGLFPNSLNAAWETVYTNDVSSGNTLKNGFITQIKNSPEGDVFFLQYQSSVENPGNDSQVSLYSFNSNGAKLVDQVDASLINEGPLFSFGLDVSSQGIFYTLFGNEQKTWLLRGKPKTSNEFQFLDTTKISDAVGERTSHVASCNGATYVNGMLSYANINHWVVRRSLDSGISFLTVLNQPVMAGMSSESWAIDCYGDMVFVSGYFTDKNQKTNGAIMISKDKGQTWTLLDTSLYKDGSFGPEKIYYHKGSNSLFLPGYGMVNGKYFGVLRRCDLTSEVCDFSDMVDFEEQVRECSGVSSDGAGVLYYLCFSNGQIRNWIVRESSDNGKTWKPSDLFIGAAAKGARPYGIGVSGDGEMLVGGYEFGAKGNRIPVIRKKIN